VDFQWDKHWDLASTEFYWVGGESSSLVGCGSIGPSSNSTEVD